MTLCSAPCFSGNLPVLSLLKIFYLLCEVRRKRIPGTWPFFHGVTYSHLRYWKFCLGSVANTRGIYFCVAEHPVPFGGGRSSLWSPFLTLCSCKLQLPVLFVWASCAIFPAVSSVKIPKWDNGWKWQKHSRKSLLTRAGPSSELPSLEWKGTKTWRYPVKSVHLSRESPWDWFNFSFLACGIISVGEQCDMAGNGKNSQSSLCH